MQNIRKRGVDSDRQRASAPLAANQMRAQSFDRDKKIHPIQGVETERFSERKKRLGALGLTRLWLCAGMRLLYHSQDLETIVVGLVKDPDNAGSLTRSITPAGILARFATKTVGKFTTNVKENLQFTWIVSTVNSYPASHREPTTWNFKKKTFNHF